MAWSHVQDNLTIGSGTSVATTLTFTVTNGNIVVGFFFYTDSSQSNQVSSVTDETGRSYTTVQFLSANPTQVYNCITFWSGPTRITNSPKTVTVALNVSTANGWLVIGEFSPPNGTDTLAVDGNAATYSTTNPPTVGPITTTKNGDLVFVGIASNGTITVGSGYTLFTTTSASLNAEFQNQSSAGSISGVWGGTPADDIMGMFALSSTAAVSVVPVFDPLGIAEIEW